jgi:hypothetical protein
MNMKFIQLAALSVLTTVLGVAQSQPETKPEIKPEMIGEGVLSTADDEFGGALSLDGKTIYYDLTVSPHYLYVLCESHLINGQWQKPAVLPFSGQYRDSDPVLTPDGKTLLFASDRPNHGVDEHRFLIWSVQKTDTGWEEPRPLEGPVNSEGSQVFASMTRTGTLYFTSDRNKGQYDIYRAKLVDGKYPAIEDLGPAVNGQNIWSLEALIAPDESYLLIGSFGRQPSFGNSDLFVSYNHNGVWSKPENLGPAINTPAREYSPRISPDGKWFIFTSERGMQTEQREHAFTSEEFSRKASGIFNGLGNLYRVPIESVLHTSQP